MTSFFKNHPFAVETHFESSTVLTFAVHKEELHNVIPTCLELDTFQDKWAFIAIAMVQTKELRPKGFPKLFGSSFFLIGYRIFVKYTNNKGKRLRGLYILKSETNKKKMEYMGNLFTHYNYTTTDISVKSSQNGTEIRSLKSAFSLKINSEKESVQLPKKSPFKNWKEARRYAGPLPFTFTYNDKKNEVLIIEGVRRNWNPKPIEIIEYNFSFIKELKLSNYILANAFVIENIQYQWKKGKIEQWKK